MALKLFNPKNRETKKEHIVVYSAPGIGKSRFVLRLTPRFGNILYFAADPSSKYLDSIPEAWKDRVFVVDMEGDDMIGNFQTFCEMDWDAMAGKEMEDGRIFPKIDTIVVDTYTTIATTTLQDTANQGLAGAEKHFRVGDIEKGGLIIPNRGDYRGNDSVSAGFISTLFDKQRNKHIIFVCHEVLKYVEDVCVGGGPSHPGRRMLTELPGAFSTVIRLIRDDVPMPDGSVLNAVVAITENDGRWVAKTRTGKDIHAPNPIARVILDRDPINFWNQYDSFYAPDAVQTEEASNG